MKQQFILANKKPNPFCNFNIPRDKNKQVNTFIWVKPKVHRKPKGQ